MVHGEAKNNWLLQDKFSNLPVMKIGSIRGKRMSDNYIISELHLGSGYYSTVESGFEERRGSSPSLQVFLFFKI